MEEGSDDVNLFISGSQLSKVYWTSIGHWYIRK